MMFFSRFNTVLLVAVATSFFVANVVDGLECCLQVGSGVEPCEGESCEGYASILCPVEKGGRLLCDATKRGDSGVYIYQTNNQTNSIMKGNDETMDMDDIGVMDTDESSSAIVGIISNHAVASSLLLAVGGVAAAAIAGL